MIRHPFKRNAIKWPVRQRIAESGLFDASFYLRTNPDVRADPSSALDHYLEVGSAKGYDPNPLFHSRFYTRKYLETSSIELNPLYHYVIEGAANGLQPHPLFDPRYYRRVCDCSGYSTPLEHYLHSGASKSITPHLLFDPAYYAPGEAAPLAHYLQFWATNRRSTHLLFDLPYYLLRYPEVMDSEYDPVSHYLEVGSAAGYNPHPVFNTAFYYRSYPDVKDANSNALLHYLEHGGMEGRDPGPWFDSSYYLESNPDVAAAHVNPLLHYLRFGESEGRSPHPLFRAKDWRRSNPEAQWEQNALAQFASQATPKHPFLALGFRQRQPTRNAVRGEAGVNIIGFPRVEIGIGECCREVARAFATTINDFAIRDVSSMTPSDAGDDSVVRHVSADCTHNTNLFVLNADNMVAAAQQLGFEAVEERFNLAMWAWELSEFPDAWLQEMRVVDEFWAISAFNQQCLSAKAQVPVLLMPQPVTVSAGKGAWSRADFGIPEHRFVFYFQFDFTGFVDRKNPYGCLAAFRTAFPNAGATSPLLVIKTNNSERYPEELRKLTNAVGKDPNIVIVNETLRRDKVLALLRASDVFMSLHRSEGFGRSLAEAMLIGKPVIGTNYSGNTDFMRPDNSCPVNFDLVPVKEGQYPHAKGQVWAEPDLDHAAWHMRRLFTNRILREQLSRAATAEIAEKYSPPILGARYVQRLKLLGLVK